MPDNRIERLREEVNPVFTTAQTCLRINAEMGDTDSQRLMTLLGFSAELPRAAGVTPEMQQFVTQKLQPGFNVMVETRFTASNRLIQKSGISQVVDLPCGYTSRGIKLSGQGIRYFGMDLPAVIDAVAPAVGEIIGDSGYISYHAVDATNYTSLRSALADADRKPLLITTEGLLMYLTQSELEEVFHNIHRMLLEFGGKWITTDNEMIQGQDKMLALLVDGDMKAIEKLAAGNMPKSAHTENLFFDRNRAEGLVEDMGFDLEKLPMFDFLPDRLHSLEHLPLDRQRAARDVFKDVYFWMMTPKASDSDETVHEDGGFRVKMGRIDDTLIITLSGRLDTITAPELLAKYREAAEAGSITNITLDMRHLDYISSAGLRVLLIMRKALKGGNHFCMTHMNDVVSGIMETTGFDSVLC